MGGCDAGLYAAVDGIGERSMKDRADGLTYITLRDKPEWKEKAAAWFHSKWGVPEEAYLACMADYLSGASGVRLVPLRGRR